MVDFSGRSASDGALWMAVRRDRDAPLELAHARRLWPEDHHLLAGHRAVDPGAHSGRRPRRGLGQQGPAPATQHALGMHDPRRARKIPRMDAYPPDGPCPRTGHGFGCPVLASLGRDGGLIRDPPSATLLFLSLWWVLL